MKFNTSLATLLTITIADAQSTQINHNADQLERRGVFSWLKSVANNVNSAIRQNQPTTSSLTITATTISSSGATSIKPTPSASAGTSSPTRVTSISQSLTTIDDSTTTSSSSDYSSRSTSTTARSSSSSAFTFSASTSHSNRAVASGYVVVGAAIVAVYSYIY